MIRQGVTLLLTFLAFSISSGAQTKDVSVCEILTDLEKFSGKMVSVRAKLESRGNVFLAAESCPLAIRVGKFDFQNLISVEWPDSSIVKLKGPKITFERDESSTSKLEEAFRIYDSRLQKLYADVEGLIVTRDPPLALVPKGRPDLQIGFGHLGMAPAQIIVKLITNIMILPKQ